MAAAFVLQPMIYRHCRLPSSPGAHLSLLPSTKSLISSPSPLQNLTRVPAAASGLIGGAAAGDDRLSGGQKDPESVHEIKAQLFKVLEGVNRGIFGVTSAKKTEIEGLIKLLESQNPTPFPTDDLTKLKGGRMLEADLQHNHHSRS